MLISLLTFPLPDTVLLDIKVLMNIYENNYMYMHLDDILKFWALKFLISMKEKKSM